MNAIAEMQFREDAADVRLHGAFAGRVCSRTGVGWAGGYKQENFLLAGSQGINAQVVRTPLLIGRGDTNTKIAHDLFLAETTVKTHVGRILQKLELRDRIQAMILTHEVGVLPPQPI